MLNLNYFFALSLLSSQVLSKCFEPQLAAIVRHGCPTSKAFCNDLLSASPINPFSAYETMTVYPKSAKTITSHGPQTTNFVTLATEILTITVNFVTTIARTTSTVTGCNKRQTCGLYTGNACGSLRCNLREACSCIFGLTTTTFFTKTVTSHTSTVTVRPRAATATQAIEAERTTYVTKTKHVPTHTIFKCSTAAPPAHTCNNRGHRWAQFTLTEQDAQRDPTEWNLDTYKSLTPDVNGTALLLGSIMRHNTYYMDYPGGYGQYHNDETLLKCSNDYINDRGYIYAPQTGDYAFHITAYNQAAFIWVGDVAVSKYNTSNALVAATAKQEFDSHGGPFNVMFLEAGKYYPLRVAWRCVTDSFDLYIRIIQPDGHIMHGEYVRDGSFSDYDEYLDQDVVKIKSPYIVQFGCGADAARAPEYPDWGSEGT